jgi:hypothetical protein
MIDQWIFQEVTPQLNKNLRVVVIDPEENFEFLVSSFEAEGWKVLRTQKELNEQWEKVQEELQLRVSAERDHANERVVFYVHRTQDELSFLFDYCFTHGCLDLSHPEEWLRKKLFQVTGLQVPIEGAKLITTAKMSRGKDLVWWKKILQNLEDAISLKDQLIPFMHDPDRYLGEMEPDVRLVYEQRLFELIGQPYMNKAPRTLAQEVAKNLFDRLLYNDIDKELLTIYHQWIDSNQYNSSLEKYLNQYKIPSDVTIWNVHPDHCFPSVDRQALMKICENLGDKVWIRERLAKIRPRIQNPKNSKFVPTWWKDLFVLLEFDSQRLSECSTFEKTVDFYTKEFYQIDGAIRNLYSQFLNEEAIIRPIQEYYEGLNYMLLQHWFENTQSYKTNQQGLLVKLLTNSSPGIAVIVGDGVRFEIAKNIVEHLRKDVKIDQHVMLADIPSETEHNMSALYVGDNKVIPVHKEREKLLSELTGKAITYMNLEAVNPSVKEDYLVLTYKDIDSAGEKLQQGAIKLFSEFESVLSEKIKFLLNNGYREVHLVTDHGFVLTGLLEESDKITPDVIGKKDVSERFIRTEQKQTSKELVGFEKKYGGFEYVYVSKSQRPFKSKGVYGFAHGGFTPQEVIIPNFKFYKDAPSYNGLEVRFSNKVDLLDVVGELFSVKVKGKSNSADLFSTSRKVQIHIYSDGVFQSKSNILTIEPDQEAKVEFSFEGKSELQLILVDSATQEQLDTCKVKKSNARDLSDLF